MKTNKVKEFGKKHWKKMVFAGLVIAGGTAVYLITKQKPTFRAYELKDKKAIEFLEGFMAVEKISDLEYVSLSSGDKLADIGKLGERVIDYFAGAVTPDSEVTGVIVAIKK